MDIVEATRRKGAFATGVSTRGAMALFKASQAKAAISGRDYIIPEDVKYTAPFVLCHRIRANRNEAFGTDEFTQKVLEQVKVPLE